jgi:hypothetical protein
MRFVAILCVLAVACGLPVSEITTKVEATLGAGAGPSGKYSGQTSVLGLKVTMTINCHSASLMDIDIAGPATVNCKDQTYSIGASGAATLPEDKDKCLYDAMTQYGLTGLSIVYEEASDSANVNFKVLGAVGVKLDLTKDGVIGAASNEQAWAAVLEAHVGATTTLYTLEKLASTGDCDQVDIPSMSVKPAQAADKNLKVGTCASVGYSVADGTMTKKVPVLGTLTIKKFKKAALGAGAGPSGTYVGSKSVLGVSITATVKVDDASTMDFSISGAATVSCPGESYTVSSSGAVVLPQDKDSCIYTALSKYKLSDLDAQFDASANTITITLKEAKFVKISVLLKHQ